MPQRSRGLPVHSLSDKCKLCCVSRRIVVPQSLSLYYRIKCTVAAWSVSVKDIVSCAIWSCYHVTLELLFYITRYPFRCSAADHTGSCNICQAEWKGRGSWLCHNFNNKYDSRLMRMFEDYYEKASMHTVAISHLRRIPLFSKLDPGSHTVCGCEKDSYLPKVPIIGPINSLSCDTALMAAM